MEKYSYIIPLGLIIGAYTLSGEIQTRVHTLISIPSDNKLPPQKDDIFPKVAIIERKYQFIRFPLDVTSGGC